VSAPEAFLISALDRFWDRFSVAEINDVNRAHLRANAVSFALDRIDGKQTHDFLHAYHDSSRDTTHLDIEFLTV